MDPDNRSPTSPHAGEAASSPHINCRSNCRLRLGFLITLHPTSIGKCRKIQLPTPLGSWERLCITFKLYNSLYAHHFVSSSRKILRSTPITSREKSFRNYKVPQINLLYFYIGKKNYPGQRKVNWVFAQFYPMQ